MVLSPPRPRAQGFGVSIADEWYRLAPSEAAQLRLYTRDSLASRQADSSSVEESVLDVGFAFARSNLTGGEGLDFYPRSLPEDRQGRDITRFWDSGDLLIERPDAGQPYALRLAPAAETWWNPASNAVDMGASGDRLYVIAGDTVHRFNDMDDTTADDTDDINVTLTQISVSPDNAVAVLDANFDVWYKAPQTEVYLQVYDSSADGPMLPAQAVWLAKGRIMVYCNDPATASDGILLEIAPIITGTPAAPTEGAHTFTTIDTFNGQVLDLVDAGHAMVAAFSDGSIRSYVPQTDTAGSTPDLTIRARAQLPHGERPYQLAWNLGTLLIFSIDTNSDHVRVYSAQVLDERFDYVVGQLQLLRTWTQAAQASPAYTSNAVATRDAIYFWIGETSTEYNLWRYDLVTTGLFRERADAHATAPTGSVMFDDRIVWVLAGDVLRESTTLKEEGYLITPNISLGLNTPINWTNFVIEVNQLDEVGVSVDLYHSSDQQAILDKDDPSWILVQTLTDPVQSGVEQTRINITSNTLTLQIRVKGPVGGTVSPEVVRFGVRGFPTHRDWIAEIPINVSDYIEAPGRRPLHIPGYGDRVFTELTTQQGISATLTVLRPPLVIRGIFDGIAQPVSYISKRGSPGSYAMVMFRGNRISDPGGGTGTFEGLGISGLGLGTMGIEESSL